MAVERTMWVRSLMGSGGTIEVGIGGERRVVRVRGKGRRFGFELGLELEEVR